MQRLDAIVEKARERARFRIAALRLEHPGQDEVALGRRLVASMALRAGLLGAATGTLSLVALPVGLPAGVAISLLLEAELIFALLELYGVDTEGEQGQLKLYALWAGAGFADAAKSVGLRAGATAVGRVLRGSLPGRIIRRLNPVLWKAILRRLGLRVRGPEQGELAEKEGRGDLDGGRIGPPVGWPSSHQYVSG